MNLILWQPSLTRVQSSLLTQFVRQLIQDHVEGTDALFDDFNDINKHSNEYFEILWPKLHQWSLKYSNQFWYSLSHFAGLPLNGLKTIQQVYDQPQKAQIYEGKWFKGVNINFAQALLNPNALLDAKHLNQAEDSIALINIDEQGARLEITWHELRTEVQAMAQWLTINGVAAGDRVAAILPNQHHAIISMLATAWVGGVFTSCSPDFGLPALIDRFGQTRPKILIACDAYWYKGKRREISERLVNLFQELTQAPDNQSRDYLKQLLVVPLEHKQLKLDPEVEAYTTHWPASWDTFIQIHYSNLDIQWPTPRPMAFNDPLYIVYSSGTSGAPKCIVHSIGGTLLQHVKEHMLHTDVQAGDRLFYFTTCGWMMWNWLASGLAAGATLVLFDGNPMYPEPSRLLQLIEDEQINIFGASAKYYASLQHHNISGKNFNLASLKTCLSTGSPLAPETHQYLYDAIRADMCVASISGGTDIVSCFALGNPWLPVRAGELQSLGLGMAVDIFDDAGKSLRGKLGELVCTNAFPSMPLGFWQDDTNDKFHNAYFSRFVDIWSHGGSVWSHGDYAKITQHNGLVIYGRSDTVLNPNGVRIGTAEIYRQVERLPQIIESMAVGKQLAGDETIWLFVVLVAGLVLNAALEQSIRHEILVNTTPRHVPLRIIQAQDLPKTRSGKISELSVKKLINGQPINNESALANPESLEFFKCFARDTA